MLAKEKGVVFLRGVGVDTQMHTMCVGSANVLPM